MRTRRGRKKVSYLLSKKEKRENRHRVQMKALFVPD